MCQAPGRLGQLVHSDLRQEIGEIMERSGRHTDAGEDRAAEECAIGGDEVEGHRATQVDHNRRSVWVAQAIGGHSTEQAVDAHAIRLRDAYGERQIVV